MSSIDIHRRVRVAARALGRHGLTGAWGHCSARIDENSFLVCPPQPMGTVAIGAKGTVVPINAPLPQGVLGEVRIHQKIYAKSPHIGGVCRVMPPITMALSTLGETPIPRHGVGAFVSDCQFWDDPRLLRDDDLAKQLVDVLGEASAIVMRANGAVTVGESLEVAAGIAWCLEDTAKIDQIVRSMSHDKPKGLSLEEIASRQITTGGVFERLWSYLSFGDEESYQL